MYKVILLYIAKMHAQNTISKGKFRGWETSPLPHSVTPVRLLSMHPMHFLQLSTSPFSGVPLIFLDADFDEHAPIF